MSFRKRNIGVGSAGSAAGEATKVPVQGTRPSPLDGRLTISTGTRSLDGILAGHAGLALGTMLLVEESGTTDFGGAMLRYYAAEGVVQGQQVHVLGMGEAWGRELPGLAAATEGKRKGKEEAEEKMKIAWRYERLGEFGAGARERAPPPSQGGAKPTQAVFCHDFDLSKRLTLPSTSQLHFVPTQTGPNLEFSDPDPMSSPFTRFLSHLSSHLASSPTTIHRVVVPMILSPALYPSNASQPEIVLQFLHALRALLRKYPLQLTAMITLPLTLRSRSTGLTRWMELLSDGVLELAPFPPTAIATKAAPGNATVHEEPPQGMLKIHRLPIFHEKGGGGSEASGFGDDLAFTLSRRKGLVIKPFSLPPVEGDAEAQAGNPEGGQVKATKVDIEF